MSKKTIILDVEIEGGPKVIESIKKIFSDENTFNDLATSVAEATHNAIIKTGRGGNKIIDIVVKEPGFNSRFRYKL